jgi:hypothetical protein
MYMVMAMTGNYTKILHADNGFIVIHKFEDEITYSVVESADDNESMIKLLNLVKDLHGDTYNKFAEENENIFIIKGPGHKSDKFSKYYDIVYGGNDE